MVIQLFRSNMIYPCINELRSMKLLDSDFEYDLHLTLILCLKHAQYQPFANYTFFHINLHSYITFLLHKVTFAFYNADFLCIFLFLNFHSPDFLSIFLKGEVVCPLTSDTLSLQEHPHRLTMRNGNCTVPPWVFYPEKVPHISCYKLYVFKICYTHLW